MTRLEPSFGRVDAVEPRADPVERAEQRVVEAFAHAIGVDHAVHQLFGAGVDPARLVDRSVDQLGFIRVEFGVAAHAVDFAGRGEQDALLVLDALAHDRQVGLEVELEHPQRFLHVGGGRGDRHQRQDHVAFRDVVLDPFLVDGDVAFEEVEAWILEPGR